MKLPENQLAVIDALIKAGKKVVVVLYGGSPMELPFADSVSAILNMYLPGQNGGTATYITDESNGAITASAPFLCRDCYEQKYGVRIPTEVDAYKSRLLHTLGRYTDHVGGSESDLVIRVMRLIESTD